MGVRRATLICNRKIEVGQLASFQSHPMRKWKMQVLMQPFQLSKLCLMKSESINKIRGCSYKQMVVVAVL